MANQLQITGDTKVKSLNGVLTGTSGVVGSVPLGAANGVATLDSGGKVPVSQLPSSVVTYLGTWNAATNTPTLTNGVGDAGDMYICNVAGTVNFGAGPVVFAVGDWVLYGSGTWQKSSGQNGTVTSVGASITGGAIGITGSPITTAGTLAFTFAGTSGQYVNGAGNLTTFPTLITSIGLSMPSAFSVANSPLTANGSINVTGAGTTLQFIDGTGALQTFPSLTGYIPYTGATSSIDLNNQSVVNISHLGINTTTVPTILFRAVGDNNSSSRIAMRGYSSNASSSSIRVTKFRGTVSAPQAPQSGDSLGKFELAGYGTTSSDGYPQASFEGLATENWGATARGSKVVIKITPNTTITQVIALTINQDKSAVFENSVTGTSLIKTGGTSSQFLKADGSVDSSSYITLASLSFAAGSGAYNSTTGVITIPTNNTQITNGANYITLASLSAGVGISYNSTTGVITSTITQYTDALARAAISLTTTGTSGAATYNSTTGVLNIPQYVGGVTSVFGRTGAVVATEGDYSLTQLSDVTITSPTTGQVLKYNGTIWINDTDANTGTVTSVAMTVPTGLSVSGSPITSSGTLAVTLTAGYSIPTTASQTNWDTAYTNRITSLTTTGSSGAATLVSNTLNIPDYGSALSGYLPLTGGTLTGPLGGTSASFSSTITATDFRYTNNGYLTYDVAATGTNTMQIRSGYAGAVLSFTGLGAATFSSSVTASQFLATSSSNAAIITSTGVVGYGLVAVGSSGGARDILLAGQSGFSNGFTVQYTGTAMKYVFESGNVLIGTSTDAGYKLDVNGTGRFNGTLTVNSGASGTSTNIYNNGDFVSNWIGNSTTQLFSIRNVSTTGVYLNTQNSAPLVLGVSTGTTGGTVVNHLSIASTGAATFSSSVTATSFVKTSGTSSQFLKADGSVDSTSYAAALSGTINTIAYWDSATTIASLALATYPSLTELSYVKGVTSSIQTQLNAKQGTLTLTTTGTSGAATLVGNTLNIPQYSGGGGMAIGGSITSATAGSVLFAGASGVLAQNNANFFWDNTNSRLGIGKNSTVAKLDVVGNYFLRNTSGASGTGYGIEMETNSSAPRINFVVNGTYVGSFLSFGTDVWFANTLLNGNLLFQTTPTTQGTLVEKARLTASGQFGLNTTTIGSQFQVNGNAAIGYSASTAAPTNGLAVSGNVGIGIAAALTPLHFASAIGNKIDFYNDGTGRYSAQINANELRFYTSQSTDFISLYAGNVIGLVNKNGSIGIGNNAPTAKLDITGAANTISIYSSGYSLTGANAQSLLDLAGTWNTTGNPTAIKLNITNTASGATSNLMDLQVGGVSKFKVDKAGSVTTAGFGSTTARPWKLGELVTATVTGINLTGYITIEVNGSQYNLALANLA